MPKRPPCAETLDLLGWEPPRVTVGFEDQARVRAATMRQRIARSISETLRQDGRSRDEVAAAMGEFLGADFTVASLNAYAAPSREDHNISLERAIALLAVTRDARLVGDLIEPFGFAVIPIKYLAAIEEAMCTDIIERAEQRKRVARRNWKGMQP
jgi:hypothetical protein